MNLSSDLQPSQSLQEAISRLEQPAWDNLPIEALETYCRLLWEWNDKLNLTRHTNYDLFVKRDLLDSWQLSQLLEPGERILDVGTGGGVPGLLVALLRPDLQVTLCDCVAKKIKAVETIIEALQVKVPCEVGMIQELVVRRRYDSLVMRAVGPVTKVSGWLRGKWHCFGRLLAIKGPRWVEERADARHRGLLTGVELRRLVSYPMPDTDSMSVILQLRRQADAVEEDPREI